MKNTLFRIVLCAWALLAVTAASLVHAGEGSVVYSVADDFSIESNPSGVWSYGYTRGPGSDLILFEKSGNSGGLDYWNHNISGGAPGCVHNTTRSTVTVGTPQLAPNQATFHPGPTGQMCIYRFTSPVSGSYEIDAEFAGADLVGTSTSVHVIHNDLTVFIGGVQGFGPGTGPTYTATLKLAAGDHLDFAVSAGDSFLYDTTAIDAVIVTAQLCAADLNGDDTVDGADLGLLLAAWDTADDAADLNDDNTVDGADLGLLLAAWGDCP